MKAAIKTFIILCALICVAGVVYIFAPGGRGVKLSLAAANKLASYTTALMADSAARKYAGRQRSIMLPLLMQAVRENDIKAAQIYLMRGASANALRNATADTPLFAAIKNNSPQMVSLLLSNKANPYQIDEDGQMPIHAAVQEEVLGEDDNYKGPEIIALLAAAGVNINQADLGGMTPLMCAAQSHKPLTVGWLMQNGADLNAKDKAGRTALEIARESGCQECIDILTQGENNKNEES